jgi:hypothetical protein
MSLDRSKAGIERNCSTLHVRLISSSCFMA